MKINRYRCMVVLMVVLTVVLSGCKNSNSEKSNGKKQKLFSYFGESVYLDEAWVYAKTMEQEYESYYGDDIWSMEIDDENGGKTTFEEVVKSDIIEEIKMVKVMVSKADENDIVLNDEELDEASKQAQEFFDGLTDEDIEETQIDIEVAIKVFEENALANKVYDKIIAGGIDEVSDEEARQTTIFDLYVPTYGLDENGTIYEYTDEEKEKQLEVANEVYQQVVEGNEVTTIVTEYGLNESAQYTFGNGDAQEKFGEKYEDIMYNLADGDNSSVIKTDYGYHIIKMISLTDSEATKENKKSIIESREKDFFDTTYAEWTKDAESKWNYSRDVDSDIWDKVKFE